MQYPVLVLAWRLKKAFRVWYGYGRRADAEAGLARWEDAAREDGPTVLPLV
ncbi:MAG: transposase [Chloroflexi bacterium]|nr:transposase [Chloroflexota bacterium]